MHLEREGDIAESATCANAAVDDHHSQRPHMALRTVWLVKRVGTRVRDKHKGAAGTLGAGRAGDENRPTAAVPWYWQAQCRLTGHPLPLDIAIGRIVLRLVVG